MKEVTFACFECKFLLNEDVYICPQTTGIGRAFNGGVTDEYELYDEACEICDSEQSLKCP